MCHLPYTVVGLFFKENTATVVTYLEMLINWLMHRLHQDSEKLISQHDGAAPGSYRLSSASQK